MGEVIECKSRGKERGEQKKSPRKNLKTFLTFQKTSVKYSRSNKEDTTMTNSYPKHRLAVHNHTGIAKTVLDSFIWVPDETIPDSAIDMYEVCHYQGKKVIHHIMTGDNEPNDPADLETFILHRYYFA